MGLRRRVAARAALRALPLVVEAFGALPGFEDVDTGSLERDLKETLRLAAYSRITYTEAFETLRSKRQRSTNRPAGDIVARPVLVKGLEFNNVLVLEADKLGTREL